MSHTTKRILIADDDAEDLELLEESLKNVDATAELSTVRNGKAVLEFLDATENRLPCLIILDYSMPELNGLEVLRIVCNDSRFQNIPIVIFSTSNSPTHIRECKSNGAIEYFVKPQTMGDFEVIAAKMIALCN